jgi:hypothetical protein
LVVIVVRGLVVDMVEDVAIEEAAGGLLKTMAELTSMPSHERWLLMSVSSSKRRYFASSVTTNDIVSSSARN